MMRVFVEGVGLAGPGLSGWEKSREVLAGKAPYEIPVKLALAAGGEALAAAARAAAGTATIFASSSGDCDNVHGLLEALASPAREVSPTRFHNSVHNAAAGYWGIATQCRLPSTSLACHDGSFAAGLLEAACQAVIEGEAVALIAYDHPYPQPLHAVRTIGAPFGVALVLTPGETQRTVASFDVAFVPEETAVTPAADSALESLRSSVPAARSLPLLAVLARRSAASVALPYLAGSHLSVAVAPCGA
jgi:hypothetical protein